MYIGLCRWRSISIRGVALVAALLAIQFALNSRHSIAHHTFETDAMDHHGFPTAMQHGTADDMSFPAYSQSSDPDEELAQDLSSSEAATQQLNTWNVQTPFQAQYNNYLSSQPGQLDLGGWEHYLAAPNLMPSQAADDINSNIVSFQPAASNLLDWMHLDALQPRYNVLGQQTLSYRDLLLDETLGETPSILRGYRDA
jgi:hypothetical protein